MIFSSKRSGSVRQEHYRSELCSCKHPLKFPCFRSVFYQRGTRATSWHARGPIVPQWSRTCVLCRWTPQIIIQPLLQANSSSLLGTNNSSNQRPPEPRCTVLHPLRQSVAGPLGYALMGAGHAVSQFHQLSLHIVDSFCHTNSIEHFLWKCTQKLSTRTAALPGRATAVVRQSQKSTRNQQVCSRKLWTLMTETF